MRPIQEQNWTASGRNVVDGGEPVATCFGTHGTEVAKAFAMMPALVQAALRTGALAYRASMATQREWHTHQCWNEGAKCSLGDPCYHLREALSASGVDVG